MRCISSMSGRQIANERVEAPMKTHAPALFGAPRLSPAGGPRLGYFYAGLNAVISGFAIYINSLGVNLFRDSTLYTTLKNTVVGVALLIPVLVLTKQRGELGRLTRRQWGYLLLLAVIGGSVPYALFFRGLQLTTPVTGSLLNHAQFLLVAVLAVVLLAERVGPLLWVALITLLVGTTLGTSLHLVRWNTGALLVLLSTVLFAGGFVLAKYLLRELSTLTVMAAKMTMGSALLIAYVAATGHLGAVAHLSTVQWAYALGTGLILLAFTVTAFLALRYASATAATAIPAAAPLITTLCVVVAAGQIKLGPVDVLGLALMLVAVAAIYIVGQRAEVQAWQSQEKAATA
jgi:drug/metabolite transporter (DMT)-like permease